MSLMGDVRDLNQLAKDLGYTTESLYLVSLLELNTSQLPFGKGLKNSLTGSLQSRSQYISKGGRVILIRSTLSNLPIYLLSLF